MEHQLIVYGFETSNNMKVRIALGYKGIPYEFRRIDPADRELIAQLSGQHLTPVIQHGPVVLGDSAAILRYLESNFEGRPRLFGSSVLEQWQIEDWELFARKDLAGPMMEVVHTRVAGNQVDEVMHHRCARKFHEATAKLESGLEGRTWLVGDAMTAADITAAAVLHRVRVGEVFPLPKGFDALAPWVDRVMSYDGKHRKDAD